MVLALAIIDWVLIERLVLWSVCCRFLGLNEDVVSENNWLRERTDEASSFKSPFLLSLLALLVLLFIIRSALTVIISVEDILGKLDAKLALLEPGSFRLQSNARLLDLERVKHGLVDTGDHVGRFDERETETGLEEDAASALGLSKGRGKLLKLDFDELEETAQPLLLREDRQLDVLTSFEELPRILSVILESPREISPCLTIVAHNLVHNTSNEPQLSHVLLCYG